MLRRFVRVDHTSGAKAPSLGVRRIDADMKIDPVELSKFLSLILRHKPETIGLVLDAQGWAFIDDIVEKGGRGGNKFSREDLLRVVQSSDKKRFSISADELRIRAAQGHSVSVDLDLPPKRPPAVLYHGTATRFVAAILREGLTSKSRRQVHLSIDEVVARSVGQRHGKPAIFRVDALRMHMCGHKFYVADNGVWLVDHVPPEFLELSSSDADSEMTSRQPKLSR